MIARCIAVCLLRCLDQLIQFFNQYAFAQVAIYGKTYCDAAKATWNLLKSRGFGLTCSLFLHVKPPRHSAHTRMLHDGLVLVLLYHPSCPALCLPGWLPACLPATRSVLTSRVRACVGV